MPTLAVFSVKQFVYQNGEYWTYGGFGDYIRSLIPHFDKIILACHPHVVPTIPKGWYRLSHPKLEFTWLPYYRREHECLLKLPKMYWQARGIAAQADVINARVPDYTGICGAFWARRMKKPLFVNIVDDWHQYAENVPTKLKGIMRLGLKAHLRLYCALETYVCRGALVFAQGHSIFERYNDYSDTHMCVSSSHSAADVRSPRSLESEKIHIVSIGRCVHIKGHRHLIDAVAALRQEDPGREYRLTIAGDGPDRQKYVEQAQRLGIHDSLTLTGQLDRPDVFALLDTASIFCLPSLGEGTPKVLLEAMARGIPVVASDVGGVGSVVRDRQTGLLIRPDSSDEIAIALRTLATDRALYNRISTNGIEIARRHTVEREWTAMIDTVRTRYPRLWSKKVNAE